MFCQVTTSGQCQLRDKKHQYFSSVSLPTDSVIVDHTIEFSKAKTKNVSIVFYSQKQRKENPKEKRAVYFNSSIFLYVKKLSLP
jgi:hypothetical protein